MGILFLFVSVTNPFASHWVLILITLKLSPGLTLSKINQIFPNEVPKVENYRFFRIKKGANIKKIEGMLTT